MKKRKIDPKTIGTNASMDLVRKFHLDGIEIEQHTKVNLPFTAKDVGEKL